MGDRRGQRGGHEWGLIRYWWVAVKLVISTAFLLLVLIALRPLLLDALHLGADLPARQRASLLAAPIVSTTLLAFATIVSVFKPWGRRTAAA
ncbi:hypothetical protein ACFQX7_04415 [Luedemannella flava]